MCVCVCLEGRKREREEPNRRSNQDEQRQQHRLSLKSHQISNQAFRFHFTLLYPNTQRGRDDTLLVSDEGKKVVKFVMKWREREKEKKECFFLSVTNEDSSVRSVTKRNVKLAKNRGEMHFLHFSSRNDLPGRPHPDLGRGTRKPERLKNILRRPSCKSNERLEKGSFWGTRRRKKRPRAILTNERTMNFSFSVGRCFAGAVIKSSSYLFFVGRFRIDVGVDRRRRRRFRWRKLLGWRWWRWVGRWGRRGGLNGSLRRFSISDESTSFVCSSSSGNLFRVLFFFFSFVISLPWLSRIWWEKI